MRRIIFIILSLIWMAIIFSFSAKTGAASTEDSFFISRIIGNIVYSDFNEWSYDSQEEFLDKMDFAVRKTAHMTEYFILCILIFFSQKNCNVSFRSMYFPLLFTVLYAISDEIHQYFVPNRSCQLRDVIIDSVGGLIAVLCMFLMHKVFFKNKY